MIESSRPAGSFTSFSFASAYTIQCMTASVTWAPGRKNIMASGTRE